MLLRFMISRLNKSPSKIEIEDIDAPLISAFLDELENKRRITARSRNVRLAAIRSFFNFLALEMPERSSQIQRVLAMPCKAYIHRTVGYLTRPEIDAILAMPNQKLWSGRRDHIMLLIAVQTGARLSEITGLTYQDVVVGTGAHIKIMGKGRKERAIPLAKNASAALQVWMQEPRTGANKILFPNAKGGKLSADGVQYILRKHVASAQNICPTLKGRRVTPHILRHTMAMELLQSGVDTSVIALWLGHESIETTRVYLNANLEMKAKILAKTAPQDSQQHTYKPDDQLMSFLEAL